jgi:hypothetical protein
MIVRRINAIKAAHEQETGTRRLPYKTALAWWLGFDDRSSIRDELTELIGWMSRSDYAELRTTEAHGLAYSYLFDLLTA